MNNLEIKYKRKGRINIFFEIWDYNNKNVHALQVNRNTKDIKINWTVDLINKRYMGKFKDISEDEEKRIISILKDELINYQDKF